MFTLNIFHFFPFDSCPDERVIGLQFAYNPELVAALQKSLRRHRDLTAQAVAGGWCPPERCWWVEPTAWPAIREDLEEMFPNLVIHDQPQPAPAAEDPEPVSDEELDAAYAALGLRADCPDVVVVGAYVALLARSTLPRREAVIELAYQRICRARQVASARRSAKRG
jgi:hypothetical protein